MDPALKEVLKANRTLLIRNMIPCQEFYDQLVQHNVFPGSMMYEIKTCASAEERNAKMLELLGVRGSSVLPRFCDALQLSNHNFLAEFLRDEIAARTSGVRPETNDVFRKFPKLDKLLTDQDKDELINFLSRKMKEEVIRQGWRREPGDKEKALDAKQRQLEESFRSKELLKEKEEMIEQLQNKLTDAAVDMREKSLEIKHLSNYIEDIRNKNQKELETQIHYNVANEKSLRRLTERESDVNKVLQEMIGLMEASLTKYGYRHKDARDRAYAINNIDKAKSTLYLLLKMIDEYDLIKTKCMHLLDERAHVLLLLGAGTGDVEKDVEEINLVNVVKEFTIAKEDNIFTLDRELTTLTDKYNAIEGLAEGADAMKEMLRTLREDIIAKEDVITDLSLENEELKSKLEAIRKEAVTTRRKSVSFPSPVPREKKSVSFPSPTPREKKSVSFPSPTPREKKSVSFPSPPPQNKKSVSFPSPTPSHMSGAQIRRKTTPFKVGRAGTPMTARRDSSESETDSSSYTDESTQSELPPTPIPQLKLSDQNKPPPPPAEDAPKMKVQFNLPTNHNTRLGAVLAQGMYLPPLMKQGMDFRISGPSGPMAVAKTLNAAHTKPTVNKPGKQQTSFSIGGRQIGGSSGAQNSLQSSGLFGAAAAAAASSQRNNGQAKVLRVSSLAPASKNGRRGATNSTQFAYQAPYGQPYGQPYQMPGGAAAAGRGPATRRLWKS